MEGYDRTNFFSYFVISPCICVLKFIARTIYLVGGHGIIFKEWSWFDVFVFVYDLLLLGGSIRFIIRESDYKKE
jgi:hypothetical protein